MRTLAVTVIVLGGVLFTTRPVDRDALELPDPPGDGAPQVPPSVEAGEPVLTVAGETTTLRGSAHDSDGAITLYEWDLDGDGEYDWTNESTGVVSWVFLAVGTHSATLRAWDNSGRYSTDSVNVQVLPSHANLPPSADAGNDLVVHTGQPVEFATAGEDPDGAIVLFEWDFDGDGSWDVRSASGDAATHAYPDPGVYEAMLRVSDDEGATGTDQRRVTVVEPHQNLPPSADAGPDIEALAGDIVTLRGSGTDPDGNVTSFRWDLDGDGVLDRESATTGVVDHVYEAPGVYIAQLTVVDDENATATDTATVNVTVVHENVPPVADAGPHDSVDAETGEEVTFLGSGTDVDGNVVMFEWDFDGDGDYDWYSTVVRTARWTYEAPGVYQATLKVTDDDDATGTDSVRVNVERPPDGDPFWPSNGKISIQGAGTFEFDPNDVETVRPDIFAEDRFSLFDILVHLDKLGKIDMEYHFDEGMNTHVIDSIDGKDNWWYWAYYHGGWQESNNFRMDHYPYKDKMTISVVREDASRIDRIHGYYRDEVERLEENGGKVTIPKVIIRGRTKTLTFEDVEVTAHDLRNDTFQEGVVTAIDVIISLHDQGLIDSYKLTWYEQIGRAEILNYFVDGINQDIAYGSCGFVYEEGSETLRYGNHIHIPADYRVLNSPDYEEWFWICL